MYLDFAGLDPDTGSVKPNKIPLMYDTTSWQIVEFPIAILYHLVSNVF